jgi:GNAT superfamily N-acetyltransferase
MPPPTLIREATLADVTTILAHRRSMFVDMGFTDSRALDAMDATCRLWLAEALGTGAYRGWLAVSPEARPLAGGGVALPSWPSHPRDPHAPRAAVILNVYTEHEHRRTGLARAIMSTILDWLRQSGFQYVSLHASDAGRPLYDALGFEATNEMRLRL